MARAQPQYSLCNLRVSICLHPNEALFNQPILSIHGNQVSEYEHTREVRSRQSCVFQFQSGMLLSILPATSSNAKEKK